MNKTIIYYTSNHEDPSFEQKIIDCLLENCGDLPIVSVSQKPMHLGNNICVGDIGFSYLNEYKQILEGLKKAKTDYILTAESDFIYPPEYFHLEPNGENIYRYDNIWIARMYEEAPKLYRKKRCSEGAQMVKRDYFIEIIERYLKNPDPRHSPYFRQPWSPIHGKNACISFKTENGLTRDTSIIRDDFCNQLPYWGSSFELKNKFL